MNSVFFERIQPMPTPVYNKPDAILASVTTVLDFIRLWREFKYFHLLTDVQISTLEAKTLPVAEKERYFQDMQILLGYPDSLEEEIQRMENGGGPGNTSLLGGGLAGARGLNQSVLRPSEDTTETLKNILFGEKRTLELTPYQRAVFYTFKIESYRDRLGRDIAAKKAWANSVVQPAEKKGATAMNVVVMDDNESCEEYGVVQQNTANLPRNKRPAPPQLPCPLRSDGCEALHKQGSVYFCPIFREMSFVQKEDSIRRNNLCPTCLRAAHGTGTECSMVDVRCNYCKADRPGHNKIVCPVHKGVNPNPRRERKSAQAHVNIEMEANNEPIPEMTEDTDDEDAQAVEVCQVFAITGGTEEEEPDYEELMDSLQRPNPYTSSDQPDLTPEQAKEIGAAMGKLVEACKAASQTGMTAKQIEDVKKTLELNSNKETPDEAANHEHVFVYHHEEDRPDGGGQVHLVAPEPIREAVKTVGDYISSDTNRAQAQDFPDWVKSKYPGIDALSRDPETVQHLQVSPQDKGNRGKLFGEIHSIAVRKHKISPAHKMQVVPIGVVLEDPSVFPDDVSSLPDSKVIRMETGIRLLQCWALLDTGASLVLASRDFVEIVKPGRIQELSLNISTGNGTIAHNSYYFNCSFMKQDMKTIVKVPVTDGNPLGPQPGFSTTDRRLAEEEFLMDNTFSQNNVTWNTTGRAVKPLFLLGTNSRELGGETVNPLLHGLRPPIYSPNLRLMRCGVQFDIDKPKSTPLYFVAGKIGVSPAEYDLKSNCPRYYVQEENLRTGKLAKWQTFDTSLHLEIMEKHDDVVNHNMMLVESGQDPDLDEETHHKMQHKEIIESAMLNIEEVSEEVNHVDKTGQYFVGSASDNKIATCQMTAIQAKEFEKYIVSEVGLNKPLPHCPRHQELLEEAAKTCADCLTAGNPDTLRRQELRDAIDKNLVAVPDPQRGEGHYQFVQKMVTSEDPALTGHLAVSNFLSSLRASTKVVEKAKRNGPHHLKTLDDQNREYLEKDKYRILDPQTILDIAQGKINAQFFCRAYVESKRQIFSLILMTVIILSLTEPDSPSTPCRLVSDTSRPIYSTGRSLSGQTPAARGFTPCLFEINTVFMTSPDYTALDIKKVLHNHKHPHNILSQAYHSIRLHPADMLSFCSVWFNRVQTQGTREPYIVKNTVTDFGMYGTEYIKNRYQPNTYYRGSSHHSLDSGCRRSAKELKLEESKKQVRKNLFVDNIGKLNRNCYPHTSSLSVQSDIGISNVDLALAKAIKEDIQLTFKLFNLHVTKSYSSFPELNEDPETKFVIIFGLIWYLENDSVRPRVKLSLYGKNRGADAGPALSECDLTAEPITRRRISRLTSSIYDLMGRFCGPAIAASKLLLQKVIKTVSEPSLDFDIREKYPELAEDFEKLFGHMRNLQDDILPHPRSVIGRGEHLHHLVISHDASPLAVGSTAHCVAQKEDDGTLLSRIMASKSALNVASAPRNEKLSLLHSINLLLQIVIGLKDDINAMDQPVAFCLGDSTISCHVMSPTYSGDGPSQAISRKIRAVLSVIGGIVPNLKIQMAWVPGKVLKGVDYLTKPQLGSPVDFCNSEHWRIGDKMLTDEKAIGRFTFFTYKDNVEQYCQLPDYLRKTHNFEAAQLLHHCVSSETETHVVNFILRDSVDKPAPAPHQAGDTDEEAGNTPEEDLLALIHPEHHVKALHKFCRYEEDDTALSTKLAHYYMVTRSGKEYQNKVKFELKPPDHPLLRPVTTFFCGKWTYPPVELKCQERTYKTRMPEYSGGMRRTVFRLTHTCYDTQPLLNMWDDNTPVLPIIPTREEFMRIIDRFEFVHSTLNTLVHSLRFWRRKSKDKKLREAPDIQLYVAVWVQLIRSDQKYFPLPSKHQKNYHQGQQIYYSTYDPQDETTLYLYGNLNIPLLSSGSRLLSRCIQSVHREPTVFGKFTLIHNSKTRSLSKITTGLCGLSAVSIKATTQQTLLRCEGCRRSEEKFYRTAVGPRNSRLSSTGMWTNVSFDELGAITCSSNDTSRSLCKLTIFVFVCQDTKAVTIVGGSGTSTNACRKAISGFRLRTFATPQKFFCDSLPAHKRLEQDPELCFQLHPPATQKRNYCERIIKEIKTYLRKLTNTGKEENNRLGSLTVTDVLLIFEYIANIINLTPISPGSPLTPAALMSPGLLQDFIQSSEQEAFGSLGTGRGARQVSLMLSQFQNLLLRERNKHLSQLQTDYQSHLTRHKKHEATNLTAKVNDVCLWTQTPGERQRMARILEISPHGTSANILCGNKIKQNVPIDKLRILSIYRENDLGNSNATDLVITFYSFYISQTQSNGAVSQCAVIIRAGPHYYISRISQVHGYNVLLLLPEDAFVFIPGVMGNYLPSGVSLNFGHLHQKQSGDLQAVNGYNGEHYVRDDVCYNWDEILVLRLCIFQFLSQAWNPLLSQLHSVSHALYGETHENRNFLVTITILLSGVLLVFIYWGIGWVKQRVSRKPTGGPTSTGAPAATIEMPMSLYETLPHRPMTLGAAATPPQPERPRDLDLPAGASRVII